jgi:hypothetical protein
MHAHHVFDSHKALYAYIHIYIYIYMYIYIYIVMCVYVHTLNITCMHTQVRKKLKLYTTSRPSSSRSAMSRHPHADSSRGKHSKTPFKAWGDPNSSAHDSIYAMTPMSNRDVTNDTDRDMSPVHRSPSSRPGYVTSPRSDESSTCDSNNTANKHHGSTSGGGGEWQVMQGANNLKASPILHASDPQKENRENGSSAQHGRFDMGYDVDGQKQGPPILNLYDDDTSSSSSGGGGGGGVIREYLGVGSEGSRGVYDDTARAHDDTNLHGRSNSAGQRDSDSDSFISGVTTTSGKRARPQTARPSINSAGRWDDKSARMDDIVERMRPQTARARIERPLRAGGVPRLNLNPLSHMAKKDRPTSADTYSSRSTATE